MRDAHGGELAAGGIRGAVRKGYPGEKRISVSELSRRFLAALPALAMPVIVIGGILASIVTATESAVLAVAYARNCALVTRRLNIKNLFNAFCESTTSTGEGMLIGATATCAPGLFLPNGYLNCSARH